MEQRLRAEHGRGARALQPVFDRAAPAAITLAGFFFGADAARGEILEKMSGLIGEEGAVALEGLLKSASKPANSVIGLVTGVVLLIVGATTAVTELQTARDRIWRAPAPACCVMRNTLYCGSDSVIPAQGTTKVL